MLLNMEFLFGIQSLKAKEKLDSSDSSLWVVLKIGIQFKK